MELEKIKIFADNFEKNRGDVLRIILKYDKDGLVIGSMLSNFLTRNDARFVLSFKRVLSNEVVKEFESEAYLSYFFIGFNKTFNLRNKNLFFIGKGIKEGLDISDENLIEVIYSFLSILDEKNRDLLSIAILGDASEKLINEGIERGILKKTSFFYNGDLFDFFYRNFKPYLPGISGRRSEIIKFLGKIGLKREIKFDELNVEDIKRLVTEIEVNMLGNEGLRDYAFVLPNKRMSVLEEYWYLLDSLVSYQKPSLFLAFEFNDKEGVKNALELYDSYKAEMINSLDWFINEKEDVIKGKGFVIINTGENIKFARNFCSLIYELDMHKIVVCMEHVIDEIRVYNRGIDLSNLKDFVKKIGGELFDDCFSIDYKKEEELIKKMALFLKEQVIEEKV